MNGKRDEESLPAERKSAEIDAFLREVAALPQARPAAGRGRMIFAMDATASREPSWDRACKLQGEMFEATAALGGLEVQLVFYGGFSQCKASRWLANAPSLHRAMRAVSCAGGQTQIARVLQHALAAAKSAPVGALVFVGDAMEEPLDDLMGLAGELGLVGVPAFMFHEGGDMVAGRAFKEIARVTRGAYCPFDSSSAEQLRALLGAVAAYAAGGRRALADYGKRTGGAALLLAQRVGAGK